MDSKQVVVEEVKVTASSSTSVVTTTTTNTTRVQHRGVDSGRQLRLLATDMDSTLLDNHHQLSDVNRNALQRLHGMGIQVLLCSGRMSPCMFPYEKLLGIDMNMVCYNGALAIRQRYDIRSYHTIIAYVMSEIVIVVFVNSAHGREAVYDYPVPASSTTRILDWVEKNGYTANVYPRGELSRDLPAPPVYHSSSLYHTIPYHSTVIFR
jgi:hypothetical protein